MPVQGEYWVLSDYEGRSEVHIALPDHAKAFCGKSLRDLTSDGLTETGVSATCRPCWRGLKDKQKGSAAPPRHSVITAPTGETKRTTKSQRYLLCRVHIASGRLVIIRGTSNYGRVVHDYIGLEHARVEHTDPMAPLFHPPFVWNRVEGKVEMGA